MDAGARRSRGVFHAMPSNVAGKPSRARREADAVPEPFRGGRGGLVDGGAARRAEHADQGARHDAERAERLGAQRVERHPDVAEEAYAPPAARSSASSTRSTAAPAVYPAPAATSMTACPARTRPVDSASCSATAVDAPEMFPSRSTFT
jgi:hypothetical protein